MVAPEGTTHHKKGKWICFKFFNKICSAIYQLWFNGVCSHTLTWHNLTCGTGIHGIH